MRTYEAEDRLEDRPEKAEVLTGAAPLTRGARRRLEQRVAEDLLRERFVLSRQERRAVARLLRKVV